MDLLWAGPLRGDIGYGLAARNRREGLRGEIRHVNLCACRVDCLLPVKERFFWGRKDGAGRAVVSSPGPPLPFPGAFRLTALGVGAVLRPAISLWSSGVFPTVPVMGVVVFMVMLVGVTAKRWSTLAAQADESIEISTVGLLE